MGFHRLVTAHVVLELIILPLLLLEFLGLVLGVRCVSVRDDFHERRSPPRSDEKRHERCALMTRVPAKHDAPEPRARGLHRAQERRASRTGLLVPELPLAPSGLVPRDGTTAQEPPARLAYREVVRPVRCDTGLVLVAQKAL